MISKELLSEVLGVRVDSFYPHVSSGMLGYLCNNEKFQEEINIYELAHKCKEWAIQQKDEFKLYKFDQFAINLEAHHGVVKHYWCVLLRNNHRETPEFKGETEPDAIFKACQWVLDNKDKR